MSVRFPNVRRAACSRLCPRKILQPHELLGLLFDVFAQFFRQIVIKTSPVKDPPEPVHR